jgi:hypothetical protein
MSAFKQFLASDVIVTPFEVNKGFTFPTSQFATGSDGQLVGIDRFLGKNVNWYTDQSTTGTLTTEYASLVYSSIKQLYYSNFISSSTGDNVARPILYPGSDVSGDVLIGGVESPLYDNFLQSTLTPNRYWPTGSSEMVAIVSIPSKLFGDYIQPNSFVFEYSSSLTIIDDGEGNLNSSASFSWDTGELEYFYYSESADLKLVNIPTSIELFTAPTPPSGYTFISASWLGDIADTPFRDSGGPISAVDNQGVGISGVTLTTDTSVYNFQNTVRVGPIEVLYISSSFIINSIPADENVGNIIYTHGMAILTNQNLPLGDITTLANVICSFSSSMTIYETQYKCTIRESEFNYTLNPSAQVSGSINVVNSSSFYIPFDGTLANNVTGPYFNPYVTTVGLYDEAQNLLAIGKLSQPLPTSATTDTTILINLDR